MKEDRKSNLATLATCDNLVSIEAHIPAHAIGMDDFFEYWLPKFKWTLSSPLINKRGMVRGVFKDGPKNTFVVLLKLNRSLRYVLCGDLNNNALVYGIPFAKAFLRDMINCSEGTSNIKITGMMKDSPEVYAMASELLAFDSVVDNTTDKQKDQYSIKPTEVRFIRPKVGHLVHIEGNGSIDSKHERVVLVDEDNEYVSTNSGTNEEGNVGWDHMYEGQYVLTESAVIHKYRHATTRVSCLCITKGVKPKFGSVDTGLFLDRLNTKDSWGRFQAFCSDNEITTLFDY